MKLNLTSLALVLAAPMAFAQNTENTSKDSKYIEYTPISFEKGQETVKKFDNNSRRFNDWSISVGAGIPLIQSADITSLNNGNGKTNIGYGFYASVNKAISHAFGLSLQYDKGKTKQSNNSKTYKANTEYDGISLLGDINFTNLFRRVDNQSPYRWALHGYLGAGFLSYKTEANGVQLTKQDFSIGSLFFQSGAGLQYKVNNTLDLGARLMYIITGTDSFDGGGDQYSAKNMTEDQNSDNMFKFTLGATFKIGKHPSHLMWHDPLQEIYHRLDTVAEKANELEVCKTGDKDNDGVCDDWDRQLDTPAGARVDGSGIALDADLDGVIDLNDKCVTIPGPIENNGCPKEPLKMVVNNTEVAIEIEKALKDILFVFDKTEIRSESYSKLDLAADIIKSSGGTYLIVGHTDKKGNDAYNLRLSQGRAKSVVAELEKRGVDGYHLKSIGVGEQLAEVPETASNEERLRDRKVTVRSVVGADWDNLPKSDYKVTTKKKTVKKKTVKRRK